MGDDPALLARRFWALPSCSPARRVRPAPGLSPHRSHGGRLPLLSPDRWSFHHLGGVPFDPLRGGSIQLRAQGCPCSPARTKVPRPAKPKGKNPPDLRSPSPSRVHGGAPFSCAP